MLGNGGVPGLGPSTKHQPKPKVNEREPSVCLKSRRKPFGASFNMFRTIVCSTLLFACSHLLSFFLAFFLSFLPSYVLSFLFAFAVPLFCIAFEHFPLLSFLNSFFLSFFLLFLFFLAFFVSFLFFSLSLFIYSFLSLSFSSFSFPLSFSPLSRPLHLPPSLDFYLFGFFFFLVPSPLFGAQRGCALRLALTAHTRPAGLLFISAQLRPGSGLNAFLV